MKLFKRTRKLSKAKLLTCFGCMVVPILAVILLAIDFTIANRPVILNIPTPAMPAVNARDDFLKAGALAKKMVHHSMSNSPKPETYKLADFAACAVDAEPVIAALRAGFLKPFMEPPQRSSATVSNSIQDYGVYRNIERELTGAATHFDMIGKPGRATQIRLDGMELGVMIEHGGGLITSLVSSACVSMSAPGLEDQLPLLSSEELIAVSNRLDHIQSKLVDYRSVAGEEENLILVMFKEFVNVRSNPQERFQVYRSIVHSSDDDSLRPKDITGWFGFEFENKRELAEKIKKYYKDLIVEMGDVYHKQSRTSMNGNFYLQSFCNYSFSGWGKHLAVQSRIDLLRLEVALLRFKADNHKFPTTLVELSPKYLKSIPVDPLDSNKPYKYQLKPDGTYLLYGLRPDMVDHHGTTMEVGEDKGFDLVAGHLARKVKLPTK
ncbi:MAG: hypothetical protein ABJA67_06355 [Chthonomonadales bacterium]